MNVRPPTPGDAHAVAALLAAYDESQGAPPDTSADDLLAEWAELDLARGAWLFELDGRLAGYGCVSGAAPETLSTDGYVHPDLRGRGVGSRILELAEARARELGAPRLRNATLHADAAGRALFEARGYGYVRSFLRMAIELDGEPPELELPDGLRLTRFQPADARRVHAAIQEAFADHWGNVPEDFDAWRERRLAAADTSFWHVVKDGDEVAAAALCDLRFGAGWVGALGTRAAWRGRGLGTSLLLAAFREFHRRGETRVALGVDSENPTGAVRLYERVGMQVVWRADVYEKAL
ncbi:MAG TPA: GNAT family N-acetyltransferase [Gaiellaceae bacterium]|nr:GNAT family N-acetyltransferase [Gaiellaceae bacterium]